MFTSYKALENSLLAVSLLGKISCHWNDKMIEEKVYMHAQANHSQLKTVTVFSCYCYNQP